MYIIQFRVCGPRSIASTTTFSLVQPRQRRDDLRNPTNDLRGLDRDLATGGRSLAGGARLGVGVRETAGDRERSVSDARACARTRSVEMGLDVGGVSLDFQDHVRGEEESYLWGSKV
jgi:hypothetical protein